MARCPHRNVQQFTELCLDCGRNVYESDQQYAEYLYERIEQKRRADQRATLSAKIEEMEKELGIRHPGNKEPYNDPYGNDYQTF